MAAIITVITLIGFFWTARDHLLPSPAPPFEPKTDPIAISQAEERAAQARKEAAEAEERAASMRTAAAEAAERAAIQHTLEAEQESKRQTEAAHKAEDAAHAASLTAVAATNCIPSSHIFFGTPDPQNTDKIKAPPSVCVVGRNIKNADKYIVADISDSIQEVGFSNLGNKFPPILEISNIETRHHDDGPSSGEYNMWSDSVQFDATIKKPDGRTIISINIQKTGTVESDASALKAAVKGAVADTVAFFQEHRAATLAALSDTH